VVSAQDQVVVARIGGAHGIKGEVRMASFTADPMAVAAYAPLMANDGRTLQIVSARPASSSPGTLVVRFDGIADRTAAEALNGIELSVPRSALGDTADDEFFHADLIGLPACTPDGAALGTVIAVQNYGAGDLIEIAPPRGNTILIPFTHAAVPEIDVAGRRLVVVPPPGLIEEASS
jgi:16S rRNA processing protein RimM